MNTQTNINYHFILTDDKVCRLKKERLNDNTVVKNKLKKRWIQQHEKTVFID